MSVAYVRAKTSDGHWAAVNVLDLDDRSFRRFVIGKLALAGVILTMVDDDEEPLTTPLTKEQAEDS